MAVCGNNVRLSGLDGNNSGVTALVVVVIACSFVGEGDVPPAARIFWLSVTLFGEAVALLVLIVEGKGDVAGIAVRVARCCEVLRCCYHDQAKRNQTL